MPDQPTDAAQDPSVSEPLHLVREATRRVHLLEDQLDDARAARNEAIRRARAAMVPAVAVAAAADVSDSYVARLTAPR